MDKIALILNKKIPYELSNIILKKITSDKNYRDYKTIIDKNNENKWLKDIFDDEEQLYANYLYENIDNPLIKEEYSIFDMNNIEKIEQNVMYYKTKKKIYKIPIFLYLFGNKISNSKDLKTCKNITEFIKKWCSVELLTNIYDHIHLLVKKHIEDYPNIVQDDDPGYIELQNMINTDMKNQLNLPIPYFLKLYLEISEFNFDSTNFKHKVYDNVYNYYNFNDSPHILVICHFKYRIPSSMIYNIEYKVVFIDILQNMFKKCNKTNYYPIDSYLVK